MVVPQAFPLDLAQGSTSNFRWTLLTGQDEFAMPVRLL